ncbi:hypothetical protein TFLX_00701 [Thermoflexales bacterium]|nr:hypothetical protein TFLX_00701 [Thermoflexales bacterium]
MPSPNFFSERLTCSQQIAHLAQFFGELSSIY